jgi:DNA invertase Pin-like site-specific DNA recombinase
MTKLIGYARVSTRQQSTDRPFRGSLSAWTASRKVRRTAVA